MCKTDLSKRLGYLVVVKGYIDSDSKDLGPACPQVIEYRYGTNANERILKVYKCPLKHAVSKRP